MKPVNMRWTGIAVALGLALMGTTGAQAAQKKHKPKPSVKKAKAWTGAENSLIGIKLYDTGLKVIDVYGTPDDIQGLNIGTTSMTGGGPGMGAPGSGVPGGPGMGAPGGGKRGGGGGNGQCPPAPGAVAARPAGTPSAAGPGTPRFPPRRAGRSARPPGCG